MDINSKQQYMDTLREKYFKASKKGKGKILDEYCESSKEERKYAIKKFNYKVKIKEPHERKKKKVVYGGAVKVALVELWNIFDRPCGQRLKPLIVDEADKLRTLGEIKCSNETMRKLKDISTATIDRKLKHTKKEEFIGLKYKKKNETTLLGYVPIKTSADLDKTKPGNVQLDCVEHCGASASGEYVNTLTTVDICFGWWEGDAFMGKGQERTLAGIDAARKRSPVPWIEMHPDNGSNLLNWNVVEYSEKTGVMLSRSRAYNKNDNCFVEQKNSTHVRKPFGYLRYDTQEELDIILGLYRNELRLYKNFFQPVMKLTEKIRIKGKIHRKYDKAKTPYSRIMESDDVDENTKKELKAVYDELNPAELKRKIDKKIKKLYAVYMKQNGSREVDANKKLSISTVSYYMMQL